MPDTGSPLDPERQRLREAASGAEPWYHWGPYLAERQWGTVREDYSADGEAWEYFPFEHAASRVYRWGEDGLLGLTDDHNHLCFALALWNGTDPILKERLFGLSGPEGNHGEDVKEWYAYVDSTPTHSYMRALYRYPQAAFPYEELRRVNAGRTRLEPEYELNDTGVFGEDRYFELAVEYAKASPEDILIRVTATNHGPETATLHLLPTLWFRNTWSWGKDPRRASIEVAPPAGECVTLKANDGRVSDRWLSCEGNPGLLFTENETNAAELFFSKNATPFVKDGIQDAVVRGRAAAVNAANAGTKAAAHYTLELAPGEHHSIRLRLGNAVAPAAFDGFDEVVSLRRAEADAFYAPLARGLSPDEALVQRQALAGLLWSKQSYHFDVDVWLKGDPGFPVPPAERALGRNHEWRHVNGSEVLSMPDTWEYPWFAAWDLAFHCVGLALVDTHFAKQQLLLLLREWYMHPNGELPAYEWDFGDANPPVHAWAALRVFRMEREQTGAGDRGFLERAFQKLLLNFTWWVNRKDQGGNNIFAGGFLGLDNIGVFDRSKPLPGGGYLEQSDGTAWMGMFCLNMLGIALELAAENPVYEDLATKFFEHFLAIAGALNGAEGMGATLWDEQDEFFYDVLRFPDGRYQQMRVRSLVGLIPLLAVEVIEPELLDRLPEFRARLEWFLENRPELANLVSHWHVTGDRQTRLVALVRGHRMKTLLRRALDPAEFLSDFGVRSLSRWHLQHPFELLVDDVHYRVGYEPGESETGLFGGNSNWRGPVWLPGNFLLIDALCRFHDYYGDEFLVECPTGSGEKRTLSQIAEELSSRLASLFLLDANACRPMFARDERYQSDSAWRDYPLFYEYFHGDTGAGLGASHQTGWTALIANLLYERGRAREAAATPPAPA